MNKKDYLNCANEAYSIASLLSNLAISREDYLKLKEQEYNTLNTNKMNLYTNVFNYG
jgi:hypothetical protein